MTKDEYLAAAARIHREWSKTARIIGTTEPQNGEHIEDAAPHPEDDAAYWEQIHELTQQYEASQN